MAAWWSLLITLRNKRHYRKLITKGNVLIVKMMTCVDISGLAVHRKVMDRMAITAVALMRNMIKEKVIK